MKKGIYQVLEEIMDEKHISIAETARLCGLPDSTVRGIIIRKQKSTALEVAFKLSEGLNVSLERLNGVPEKSNEKSSRMDIAEIEHIKKYRALDTHGKDIVDTVLEKEYERVQQDEDLVEIQLVARSGKNEIIKVTRKELEEINKILDEYEADPDEEADKL